MVAILEAGVGTKVLVQVLIRDNDILVLVISNLDVVIQVSNVHRLGDHADGAMLIM